MRVPQIKTDVVTPNFSNFFSAIDQAEKKSIIKIKPEVDNSFMGGLSNSLSGQTGKFSSVGKEIGSSLTMGMQQQFGMAGGVASSFATALGPIGIVAGVAGAALIGLGAASTQAAMKWEDMKTSIGRTTGLKGDNLEDLMSQLQDLRQEFGVTAEAASSMVEQAGSIGVGQKKMEAGDLAGYKQEILDFTKATAILQGAWGMSAEATSSGIGKMGSVTLGAWNVQRKARGEEEMSWADYAYKVGGQVDNLANAMGSSEEEIVTAMRNSSGAIAKWAPTEETYGKWQAMASFLIDTGSSAGEAGTQIERVAQKLDQNSADVAKVMGIDQATLSTNLKADFMGTVQDLGEAIASMPESARPDTAKMFGLEGKVLIDKVVADIEAGTGKLQSAYDLALKPGNVKQGYEDVADNASKAFDRIGQAFQVSLEKIGGQLLPFVASIANDIADAWISANEMGTEAFATAQSRVSQADKVITETGSIWEWGKTLLGFGDEVSAQTADGILTGAETAASPAAKKVGEELKATVEDAFGDGFLKALKEAKVSEQIGMLIYDAAGNIQMSDMAAMSILNSQAKSSTVTRGSDQSIYSLMDKYTIQKRYDLGSDVGTLTLVDSSGKVLDMKTYIQEGLKVKGNLSEVQDAMEAAIKPAVLDMPKYLRLVKGDMSSELESILTDGVVAFEEKGELEEAIKKLEGLKVKIGAEFDKSGLDKTLEDYKNTKLNIKLELDTGEAEVNFFEWRKEKEAYFQTMQKGGIVPMEANVRPQWEWEKAHPGEQGLDYMKALDEAIASHDPAKLSGVVTFKQQLEALDPSLKNQRFWYEKMATAQQEYDEHIKLVNGTLVAFDSEGKQVSSTTASFNDYLWSANNGLLKFTEAAIVSAIRLGNIVWPQSTTPSQARQFPVGTQVPDWSYLTNIINSGGTGTAVKGAIYTKQSLKNALAKATYQEGGITSQEGAAWLHANEIVIPSGALPCAVSSQYQMLENPQLFKRDTISSSSTGQVWDAHDLGYNIKSVSNNLNDLNGCVSSSTQIFQEQNAAALFFQTGGIYPTAQKLVALSKNLDTVNAQYQQQIPLQQQLATSQYATVQGAQDVSDSFTWVSDLFWDKDMYDRLTISPPTSGYQSSAKRGQVPVGYSDAALAGMGFRNPFTDETASSHFGMADRIFAIQQQYSGKSNVMPSGPNERPDWIVAASGGVIPKQSEGVLNPMAVEYDTLDKVNTARVKYADLLGTELRNTLLQSDATLNLSAAGGQYCEAMSQMGIMTEEAARKAEKNGMFFKGYIGPTKDYEAAKAYFASETLPSIEENTDKLDYWGNSVTSFTNSIDKNTDAQKLVAGTTKQTSDILSAGTTAKALSWSLTEFDTYIASAESGLNSCIQSLSDWAIYQESILSMPVELGGQGFFKQESLGGFEKLYPQWGPFATEAKARGMPGPWGGDAEKTAGYITSADGIKQALDGSQLSQIMSKASASTKETAKNTAQTVEKITDLNGNIIATRDAYGNVMSDLVSGAYGSGGAAWGAYGSRYGGSYGSFFGGWSGGGVGSGSTSSGWGAQAVSGGTGSFGGSQGWGSVQWAEGGITDRPTYGVFGEAGREAFVPISDRAAGLRILPQVMRELGVRTFAQGGIVGGFSAIMESVGGTSIGQITVINHANEPVNEEKLAKKILAQVAKKDVLARKRRG